MLYYHIIKPFDYSIGVRVNSPIKFTRYQITLIINTGRYMIILPVVSEEQRVVSDKRRQDGTECEEKRMVPIIFCEKDRLREALE